MRKVRDGWSIPCALVAAAALVMPVWAQADGNPLNGVRTPGISVTTVEAESGGAPTYEIGLRLDSDPRTVIADLADSPIGDRITRISYSLLFADAASRARRPPLNLAGVERLTALRELRVNEEPVIGLEWLASSPSIRTLDLDRVPGLDAESLRELTTVEELSFRVDEAISVAPLRSMTGLRRLTLGFRAFRDLEALADLPNLERLEIYQPREGELTSFEPVAAFTQIKSLALAGLGVWPADFAPIARLQDLESLEIESYVIGDFHLIASMSGLRRLDLDINPYPQPLDLSFLSAMTQLEELDLSVRDSPFTLRWLSGYTGLRVLNVGWIEARDVDADLEALRGLSTLEELSLINLDRTEEVDLSAVETLTGLRKFTLSGFRSDDYSPLAQLPGLEELDLSNSNVNDLDFVAAMTSLRELDVGLTRVRDISPLAGLPRLETLSIAETGVRRLDALAEVSSLKNVDVREAPIQDYSVLEGMPGVSWDPPAPSGDALQARLSGHTYHTYDTDFGNQIEYASGDGRAYLWFPGNAQVLEGEWRVSGDQICSRYAENTVHPTTGERGGSWECAWGGLR